MKKQAAIDKCTQLYKEDRSDEALTLCLSILKSHQNDPELLGIAGVFAKASGNLDQAEILLKRAIKHWPSHSAAWFNLGEVYRIKGRLSDAINAVSRAVQFSPDFFPAENRLGQLYLAQSKPLSALEHFQRSLNIEPGQPDTLIKIGFIHYLYFQNTPLAMTFFNKALTFSDDAALAQFNLAIAQLRLGQLSSGLAHFEIRWDSRLPHHSGGSMPVKRRKWDGDCANTPHLLIWSEQGYGDDLQFVRYLGLLKQAGIREITLVCKPGLKRLFQQLTEIDHLYDLNEWRDDPKSGVDAWCFLMSLAHFFNTTLETIPNRLPYLKAPSSPGTDPGTVPGTGRAMRPWNPPLLPSGTLVGLVWAGRTGHDNNANRSLSGLAQLAPLWRVEGVQFVSLQVGDGAQEATRPPPGLRLYDWGCQFKDFADTADAIARLDLVICVDTAVAHLAGAMGKPVWVLLPFIGLDWRWLEEREDSPWYPQVMRLFRQKQDEPWESVIDRVTSALASRVRRPDSA